MEKQSLHLDHGEAKFTFRSWRSKVYIQIMEKQSLHLDHGEAQLTCSKDSAR